MSSSSRWTACQNVSEVRMFLGTIGVCRVFIKDFARLAGPLNNLLRKGVIFEWKEEHDTAMQSEGRLVGCSAFGQY